MPLKKKKEKKFLEIACLGMDLADMLPKKHLRKLLGLCYDILVHFFGSFLCGKGHILF